MINIIKKQENEIIQTYIICPTCSAIIKIYKQIMCPECHANMFNIKSLSIDIEERIDYHSSIVYKNY